jgi:hypothetical protein
LSVVIEVVDLAVIDDEEEKEEEEEEVEGFFLFLSLVDFLVEADFLILFFVLDFLSLAVWFLTGVFLGMFKKMYLFLQS